MLKCKFKKFFSFYRYETLRIAILPCPVPLLTRDIWDTLPLNSSISQNSTKIAGRSHSADDLAEFISGFVTVSSVIAPRFLRLLNLLGAQEHQAQLVDKGLNVIQVLRREILGRHQEVFAVAFSVGSHRVGLVPEQPVRDVDVIQEVLRRGLLLQNVGDGHVEVRD